MTRIALHPAAEVRCRWHVRGQVQGVGFRPFVHRIARRHSLTGFVQNNGDGVIIETQGHPGDIDAFRLDLLSMLPPLARIDHVHEEVCEAIANEEPFAIRHSEQASNTACAAVTMDSAVCPDCLAEMFNPTDRRAGHALINCTNCGPRFTIIERIPYDRPNTTMASFTMCEPCRHEYENPADRRFHAQPTACPACGPQVELLDADGRPISTPAIATAARMIEVGSIVAIKGLGGYHLCVRADDAAAILRLRHRKARDRKPFALMVRSVDAARTLVTLSDQATEVMRSPACPIVLAPKRHADVALPGIADANHRLGVMLPYTPIQHLLFAALDPTVQSLVMTSANVSDEPLVVDDDEAVSRLGMAGLCDAILRHDRPIRRPVDDSVLVDMAGTKPLPIRRARGFVPMPIALRHALAEPGLCVGGELKNTVAVARESEVILSHHLGDLKHPAAFMNFRATIDDMCDLFNVTPRWIAHDMHPTYLSTTYARKMAERTGALLIGVQHHHAHAAAVMAEHGIDTDVLAIVCDGVGYGEDGSIWGGELLAANPCSYRRLAHLRPLMLPGGDAAAIDTRRCAMAMLHQAYGPDFQTHPAALQIVRDASERSVFCGMIRRNLHCAPSSAAGRFFDGVAALLGQVYHNEFEAQAAMALEALAAGYDDREQDCLADLREGMIDLGPVVRTLLTRRDSGDSPAALSAFFHDQFALAWTHAALNAIDKTGIRTVVLSGGVFSNERLTRRITERLSSRHVRVLRHDRVPANDGGIALGQAAVAAARLAHRGGKAVLPCV